LILNDLSHVSYAYIRGFSLVITYSVNKKRCSWKQRFLLAQKKKKCAATVGVERAIFV
jgi:hypothetical protein